MRRLLPTLVLIAAACAPAPQSPLQAPVQAPARINETGGGYEVRLNPSGQPVAETVNGSVAKVWPVAVDAYARAGLRIDGSDPAQHIVQTRGQIMRRVLNGRSLSNYFDCGTELSGNIADSWRIKVDAHMAVGPGANAESSQLATMLTVTATPVEGTSASLTQCSSKGLLEQTIATYLNEALAKQ